MHTKLWSLWRARRYGTCHLVICTSAQGKLRRRAWPVMRNGPPHLGQPEQQQQLLLIVGLARPGALQVGRAGAPSNTAWVLVHVAVALQAAACVRPSRG